jgi:hypothetical protein
MAVRLGVDMKLFDAMAKASRPTGSFTVQDLCEETGSDPLLVSKSSCIGIAS